VVLTLLHIQAFLHINVPGLALTAFTRTSLSIAFQGMSNPTMKQEDTNSLFSKKFHYFTGLPCCFDLQKTFYG
jgi:hypothetical protein